MRRKKYDDEEDIEFEFDESAEDIDESVQEYYPDDDYEDEDVSETFNETNKKKRKYKPVHWVHISIILVLCMAILLVVAWIVIYKPRQKTEVPFNTDPVVDTDHSEDTKENTDTSKNPSAHETADPSDGRYKIDNDESYNILVVGHDKLAFLADVIMIVNFNARDKAVSVMQLPRDTHIELSDENIYLYTNKINEVYSNLLNENMRLTQTTWYTDENYLNALDDFAKIFEKSLCISIHHKVLVDLEGFKSIVDAIGGVPLYVPAEMHYSDPDQNLYINLTEGYQTLDGYHAEMFVRYRSGWAQADLGRVNAQKIFITAFFNKVKSLIKNIDVNTLNNLATEVVNNVYTDMSISDVIYYAKQSLSINLSEVSLMTAPGNIDASGSYYVLNREGMLNAINDYFNIYNKDITDAIFDRNTIFNDSDVASINYVYTSPSTIVLDQVYNGEEVDEDSIYIPQY